MGKRVLTPEMEKYFVENAFKESGKSMSRKFRVSNSVVKLVFKNHNIIIPENIKNEFRSKAMQDKTTFTPEEDAIIIDNYLDLPIKRIGKLIGRSYTGINGRLRQLGLSIPQELRDERKKMGMYRKGSTPANKGKKMSSEVYERTKHTFFKKGNIPHNAKNDWEEVQRSDSSGRAYWRIKLPGKRKLVYKHIWLWEKEYGEVPTGYNIIFKNGNSLDCRIENLECISNAELMSKNSLHRFPEDLRKIIQLKGALKRQINKIEKNG